LTGRLEMIINVEEEKTIVVSDLHYGNPFSSGQRDLMDLLTYAADNGYSVIINGDGIDVAQSSFKQIARDLPGLFQHLKKVSNAGNNVYYVIGNHDIVLEHILLDWDFVSFSPFLNVSSGDRRIRVEHSHLYDSMFMNHPNLYEAATVAAGFVLHAHPPAYVWWHKFEELVFSKSDDENSLSLPGEPATFVNAAQEILQRGFDTVIFGHTHHPGTVDFGERGKYVNSGSWMVKRNLVLIENGTVSLKLWNKNRIEDFCPSFIDQPAQQQKVGIDN